MKGTKRQSGAALARFRMLQKETTDPLAIGLVSDLVRDLEAENVLHAQPGDKQQNRRINR
jgi:hypothetical protein